MITKNMVLEKMQTCEHMPFNKISNAANIFLQAAYSVGEDVGYIQYRKWYYDKGCDLLDNPDKYEGMGCTDILNTFNKQIRKIVTDLHKENDQWYLALSM